MQYCDLEEKNEARKVKLTKVIQLVHVRANTDFLISNPVILKVVVQVFFPKIPLFLCL